MKTNRLSRYRVEKILRCFCEDLTVPSTAQILGLNRKTINAYYNEFREKIFEFSIAQFQKEIGEFEVDESTFGARRVRGKRGRGAAGKTPVFGLLKREGHVFVKVVPDCSKESLLPIIGKFWRDPRSMKTAGKLTMA